MKLVRFIDFFDYDGLYKKVLKMNNPKQRLQGYSFPQPLSIKQVSSVNILQPPPSSNLPKFNLIPNHQNKHQQPRSFLPVIFSTQQKQVGGSAEEMDEKGDYGSDLKSSQEESYIMRKPPPSIEFIVLQNQLNLMKNNNFPKINRIQDIFGNKDRVSSKLFLTESQLISPLTKPIIADKQSTAYKPIRQGNRLSIKQHPSIELKVSQSNVSKVSYQSQQNQQQKGDQLDNLQEIVRRKKQDNKKLQSLYRSILQLEVSQGKQSVKQAFLGKTEQIIQFKKILEGSFNVHSNFKAK